MAQLVHTYITVEGIRDDLNGIKTFSSFILHQEMFEHHSFHLTCPAHEICKQALGFVNVLSTATQMIGKRISILIEAASPSKVMQRNAVPSTLNFAGIITQVEAARDCGEVRDIILSGFSETILLDNGPNCKTWENNSVDAIARELLQILPKGKIPAYWIPPFPHVNEPLPYTVQYKETAWEFLNRLMLGTGHWCYADGWMDLRFGINTLNEAVKLVYGANLSHFSVLLQVRPSRFQVNAYDYVQAQAYSSKPQNISDAAGLDELANYALKKGEELYKEYPKQWYHHQVSSKRQLDECVNNIAARNNCDLMRFTGQSDYPGLKLGEPVEITGKNLLNYPLTPQEEELGRYTVISLKHYCDGQGNYINQFMALPASVTVPPNELPMPFCETQSALVTDNHDPNGLGRIRVRFHWMSEAEQTPWIRIASSYAGNGKGTLFIPEKNEEVMVGFEAGDPQKPYVVGAVYNGAANVKGINDNKNNDIKLIKTRSGHTIQFDDKENGSITILTPGGHKLVLNDWDKTISISGSQHVAISSDETISVSSKEINMEAEEINLKANKKLELTAGNIANMKAVTTNIKGSSRVNIN